MGMVRSQGIRRRVPSPSSVLRYLAGFHPEDAGRSRRAGKASIPKAPENLVGLYRVHGDWLAFAQKHAPTSSPVGESSA